jgi:hypothetical protein
MSRVAAPGANQRSIHRLIPGWKRKSGPVRVAVSPSAGRSAISGGGPTVSSGRTSGSKLRDQGTSDPLGRRLTLIVPSSERASVAA